jgi:hypothetical protein
MNDSKYRKREKREEVCRYIKFGGIERCAAAAEF